jgi:hypothetical protein
VSSSAGYGPDVGRAEAWIRNAGFHLDESELEDELFGDRGRLRDRAGDVILRSRLRSYWWSYQPARRRLEAEEAERAEEWRRLRALLEPEAELEGGGRACFAGSEPPPFEGLEPELELPE